MFRTSKMNLLTLVMLVGAGLYVAGNGTARAGHPRTPYPAHGPQLHPPQHHHASVKNQPYEKGELLFREDCRGDAKNGHLLYMTGGANSQIDLELMPDESHKKVHTIATICGKGHKITISAAEGKRRDKEVPLMKNT